jgi:protein SCO1/2
VEQRAAPEVGPGKQVGISSLRARLVLAALALITLLPLASCKKGDPIEILSPPSTPQTLQKYWTLPNFALTERSGQTVGLSDLAGKVWVADFIYTTCPGPCPILTGHLSDLQKALGDEPGVRLVSISTDPDNDTPEALTAYAERFKAGDHWLFLTGKKDAIYSLARDGFKLPIAEATPGGEGIVHSTRLILVDKTGDVRGFYEGIGGDGLTGLMSDIRRLLKEK